MAKTTVTALTGGITAASGFVVCGVKAGIKTSGNLDLAMLYSESPCDAAGAFTTNAIRAPSVDWCDSILPTDDIRAIVCNAGCANACTGTRGAKDNAAMAAAVSSRFKMKRKSVLTASTGVIGKPLPIELIDAAIPKLIAGLANTLDAGTEFAEAIMTTDLVKKESAVRVSCDTGEFTIGGTAKGSGMISPDMATMLCFITTDADIGFAFLNDIVKRVVSRTFNFLTVDGDTSTNDMVLVMANGASGALVSRKGSNQAKAFEAGLYAVCNDLCQKIAADGEGATKRIEIIVTGAKNENDARLAAKAVANSNLTKCALFGNDPNWGRIACAIGYSGARFSQKMMSIKLCGIQVFKNLQPVEFDWKKVHSMMQKNVVKIEIDLGLGMKTATAHTCDFSYDYVKINAEYYT